MCLRPNAKLTYSLPGGKRKLKPVAAKARRVRKQPPCLSAERRQRVDYKQTGRLLGVAPCSGMGSRQDHAWNSNASARGSQPQRRTSLDLAARRESENRMSASLSYP